MAGQGAFQPRMSINCIVIPVSRMAKLIMINARDLKSFINFIKKHGYQVVEGEHAVLVDNSEVCEYIIKRGEEVKGLILAHYVSIYYKVISENKHRSDDELLKALLKAKYSGNKWFTPVNPVALVTNDTNLESIVGSYNDDYPCPDAREYSERYKSMTPGRVELFSRILASLLKRISRERSGR